MVQPGASIPIRVGVHLRQEGVRERVRLSINSNDPTSPKTEYAIEASCPAPFDVSPTLVDFGSVTEGQTPSIVLTVRKAHGLPLEAGTVLHCTVLNEHVSAEATKQEGDDRQLVVRLRPNAPRGHLQAEVKLTVSGIDSPINVPVTACVVGQVLTAPQSLVLSAGKEARFLVWRPDGRPLGKLARLELPQGVAAEEVSDRTATRRVFRVRYLGPINTKGPNSVRLWFEALSEPVVVRVSATN